MDVDRADRDVDREAEALFGRFHYGLEEAFRTCPWLTDRLYALEIRGDVRSTQAYALALRFVFQGFGDVWQIQADINEWWRRRGDG
jgi:hypothetical protein